MPRTPFEPGDAQLIVVNTNEDGAPNASDGKLTLREAIELSQKKPGSYYINFHNPGGKHGTHNLNGLGYWTIELQEPLPAIEEGNIIINAPIGNQITSKNVTLVPASDGKGKLTRSLKGKTQMSMMTVGDVDHFMEKGSREVAKTGIRPKDAKKIGNTIESQSYSNTEKGSTWPWVELYHFNFIKHKAQGGDGGMGHDPLGDDPAGGGGAGGGLGTGAGLSIVGGDVFLQNAVFQDLKVQGGSSRARAKTSSPNGLIGGWMGGPNYEMQNLPTNGIASPHGFMGDLGSFSGGAAPPTDKSGLHGYFGQGGSGGGMGGNGGCSSKTINLFGGLKHTSLAGGAGANGTNGGFGAGGGVGGWGGRPGGLSDRPDGHFVRAADRKCKDVKKAAFGADGRDGLHGFGSLTISPYMYAGDGAALGAGVSVLNYHSNLILDRVDFVRNQAVINGNGRRKIQGWDYKSLPIHDLFTVGNVYAKDVNLHDSPSSDPVPVRTDMNYPQGIDYKDQLYYFTPLDESLFIEFQKDSSNRSFVGPKALRPTPARIGGFEAKAGIGGIFPFQRTLSNKNLQPLAPLEPLQNAAGTLHVGSSFITNKEHVKIRPAKPLANLNDRNDINIINMESPGLGVIKIEADSSSITEGLNTAFGMLLPDRSSEIEAEYAAKVDSVWTDALSTAGLGFLADGYKAFEGPRVHQEVQNGALGKTKHYNRKYYTATGMGAAFAVNVGTAIYSVYTGLKQAEENRDIQLEENAKSQEKLAQLISKDRNIKFNDITTKEARTIVQIDNFKIGEDVVIFPGLADKYKLKYELTTKSKGDKGPTIDVSFQEKNLAENTAKTIARISLNKSSYEQLAEIDADSYLTRLTNESLNGDLTLSRFDFVERIQFKPGGTEVGPASSLVRVDRSKLNKSLKTVYDVNSFQGDDLLVGDNGSENFAAGPGIDTVFPLFGESTIDGGEHFDTVKFTALTDDVDALTPVDVRSVVGRKSMFNVESLPSTKGKKFKGKLMNIESIHAAGASNFDLSKLPKPQREMGIPFYEAYSGAGSTVEGSAHDDVIGISLQKDHNPNLSDTTGWWRNNNSWNKLKLTSFVNAGEGVDHFILDLGEAHETIIKGIQIKNVRVGKAIKTVVFDENTRNVIAVTEGVEKFTIEGLVKRERAEKQPGSDHRHLSQAKMSGSEDIPAELLPDFEVVIVDLDEEWNEAKQTTVSEKKLGFAIPTPTVAGNKPSKSPKNPSPTAKGKCRQPSSGPEVVASIAQKTVMKNSKKVISGKTRKNDRVVGTKRKDVLASGPGRDHLIGKGGNDFFLFKPLNDFGKKSADVIRKFGKKERIIVDGSSLQEAASGDELIYFVSTKKKRELKRVLSFSDVPFVYFQKNKKTGMLYYNENGCEPGFGDGGLFASIVGNANIDSSHLRIV